MSAPADGIECRQVETTASPVEDSQRVWIVGLHRRVRCFDAAFDAVGVVPDPAAVAVVDSIYLPKDCRSEHQVALGPAALLLRDAQGQWSASPHSLGLSLTWYLDDLVDRVNADRMRQALMNVRTGSDNPDAPFDDVLRGEIMVASVTEAFGAGVALRTDTLLGRTMDAMVMFGSATAFVFLDRHDARALWSRAMSTEHPPLTLVECR